MGLGQRLTMAPHILLVNLILSQLQRRRSYYKRSLWKRDCIHYIHLSNWIEARSCSVVLDKSMQPRVFWLQKRRLTAYRSLNPRVRLYTCTIVHLQECPKEQRANKEPSVTSRNRLGPILDSSFGIPGKKTKTQPNQGIKVYTFPGCVKSTYNLMNNQEPANLPGNRWSSTAYAIQVSKNAFLQDWDILCDSQMTLQISRSSSPQQQPHTNINQILIIMTRLQLRASLNI